MKLKTVLAVLFILFAASAFSDSFFGNITSQVSINGPSQEKEITFKPEELIVCDYTGSKTAVEGMEIELFVPRAIIQQRNSFVVNVYKGIHPQLLTENKQYTGSRILQQLLPASGRVFIKIPFGDDTNHTSDMNTLVANDYVTEDSLPFVFTITPVMKGLPDVVFFSDITMKIRPIIKETGYVMINTINTDTSEKPFQLFINNTIVDSFSTPVALTPGIHAIRLISDYYRNITTTITVERGKTIDVNLELKPAMATIVFDLFLDCSVFIDGSDITMTIDNGNYQVNPGEHTITCIFDDYKISKQFLLEAEKSYTFSLLIDFLLKETKPEYDISDN